jgi:glycosyltransferase involved in cell wall biosynthesis
MAVRRGNCGLHSYGATAAYAALDLVLLPSNQGEGLGFPPIEAAMRMCPDAVGAPTLASKP